MKKNNCFIWISDCYSNTLIDIYLFFEEDYHIIINIRLI